MFDGLLDGRRSENSSPDTPTLSLICHPMQVDPRSPPIVRVALACRSRKLSGLRQVLRISGSHSRQPKRTLFICRHGERMDVVFGKHWLSLCSDSKGERSHLRPTRAGFSK